MNTADNEQRTTSVDSLLNAETVKYFSMEAYEVNKYKEKILDYQVQRWAMVKISRPLIGQLQPILDEIHWLKPSLTIFEKVEEWKSSASLVMLNVLQSVVMNGGQ